MFVDASGTRAHWPVGGELVDVDGRRLPGPRGTGRPALVIASVAAAVMLALLALVGLVYAADAGLLDDPVVDALSEPTTAAPPVD